MHPSSLAGKETYGLSDLPPSGTVYHPTFGQVVNYQLMELPDSSDGQVAATIEAMIEFAIMDCQHPLIIDDAAQALIEGDGDPILGVFRFIKNRLQFAQDADQVSQLPGYFHRKEIIELLIRPVDASLLIRNGRVTKEDCDGFACYAVCLLLALQVNCCLATVAANPDATDEYSHVYAVAYPNPGSRIPLDTSHGEYAGWEAPSPFGKMREWPCVAESRLTLIFTVLGLIATGFLAFFTGRHE